MLKAGRRVLAVALACAATQAAALDVDQIEIRSQMGQPLLAEIPIVSSDPAELRNLQAQLATAVTFARVGLERPRGAVAALQFAIARDARGKPVIRVTTASPVTEDFFTFIVELDWGNGHLVRQYSVALDNPNTLTAALPPPIQAPLAGPSNLIERSAPVAIPLAGERAATAIGETPPIPLVGAAPSRPVSVQSNPAMATPAASVPPTRPQPKPVAAGAPRPALPVPKPAELAPKPVAVKPTPPPVSPKPQVATPPAATPPAPPSSPPPSALASTVAYTVKPGDNLAAIAAREGRDGFSRDQTMIALLRANPEAFIGGNINRIRQGAALQVPDAAETGRVSAAEAALMVRQQVAQWRNGGTPVAQPAALAGADGKAASPAAPAAVPVKPDGTPPSGARLEIVPAAANAGGKAGMRSGVEAGGAGDTLRKELDEKRETLAARDVELKELRRRVAGLEKIQQDQQKLIAMQGSALAAAQQTGGAIVKQDATSTPVPAPDRASVWPWVLASAIVLGLLGWLVARSRRATPLARSAFDAESLAAAIPREEPAAVAADDAIRAGEPTWHARSAHEQASDAAVAGLDPHSAGYKKIRLAQAHIDLGDADAARPILRDVVEADDDAAATVALRLLYNLDHPARA